MRVLGFIFFVSWSFLLGCGNSSSAEEMEKEKPQPEYSLMLGDTPIAVDSISANVWFEDQLNGNVLTLKVYCTSEYPVFDSTVLIPNHYVRFVIQSKAEVGTYYLGENGDSWINSIRFELPTTGGSSLAKNDRAQNIRITAVDLKNQLISCEVVGKEYLIIPFQDQLSRNHGKLRPVTFKATNLPFTQN